MTKKAFEKIAAGLQEAIEVARGNERFEGHILPIGIMKMSKRHSDALGIWEGACNPSGIAHSLVSACRECIDENVSQREDPAVRLITAQLAYIVGIWDGVSDFSKSPDAFACEEACRKIIGK